MPVPRSDLPKGDSDGDSEDSMIEDGNGDEHSVGEEEKSSASRREEEEEEDGGNDDNSPETADSRNRSKEQKPSTNPDLNQDLLEKHRLECLDNLEKIEKEFSDLKEKFFRDQMEALKAECEAIKLGSHEKFLEKVKELEEKKSEKLWAAQQWREYQLNNINIIYDAEKRQSEEEYKIEKRQLRDRMVHAIEDKIKKLEDEKNTMNLIDGGESRITRTLRRRGKEPARDTPPAGVKRKLNPPHINYTLKESEILEDLALIQRPRDLHSKHARLS